MFLKSRISPRMPPGEASNSRKAASRSSVVFSWKVPDATVADVVYEPVMLTLSMGMTSRVM